MKTKKIILITLLVLIVAAILAAIFAVSGTSKTDNSKIQIVSTNFASYDFIREIIGDNDNIQLTFLLGAGKDTHSYEPTAQDIIKIQNSDLFIYIGGEMEKWVDKVLESMDNKKFKTVCIADYVDTIEEQEIDGAEPEEEEEEEGAFDEHIWTSPANAIKMVNILEKEVELLDNINTEKYKNNAEKYVKQIQEVDKKIQQIVDNKVRDRLIFADKMPMQYFINYYNLKVTAAFSGCSTETEPSASTIAYIENKAREEGTPVILYIELNPGRVAETIAQDVGNGCKAMQIQTLHNVSLDDFNAGETWVSLMTRNLDVLKKALQ